METVNKSKREALRSWIGRTKRFALFTLTALLLPLSAEAQQGPRTFAAAAKEITGPVAGGSFGAMVVAITGVLAIVSAVTGSYKGAWAVLYVSVGLFILKDLVRLLFTVG